MKLNILTPERSLFTGIVTSVKVPGANGQFQVLKNHAPIVAALINGTVEVTLAEGTAEHYDDDSGKIETLNMPGKKVSYRINNGFIEVNNNTVALLVTKG